MTISRELLDELLSGVERPEDLLGDKGLMKELKVRLMERMLGAELTGHLVHELMEARDERRPLRLQKQMANCKLLIIDELGFVPLSKTGAELLFELISQRYERGATLITSNLPFDEWTETFGSERPDRRASGPPDPSRQHPRDERRQLSSGPKPGPQRHRHQPGSGQIGPRGPKRPGTRQLYRERRHLGALRIPGARFRHPQVANICSATWPVFAPPLTEQLNRRGV